MTTKLFYRKIEYRLLKFTGAIIPGLYRMRFGKRLILGRNPLWKKHPVINIVSGANICIGNNVTLNSSSREYHVLLHSPVKLLADSAGAMITIGDNTRIHGSCLHAWQSITIGRNCLIAANTNIIDSNGHELSFEAVKNRLHSKDIPRSVIIEDNVWIGTNTLILPGTHVGAGSVIGAGSVVRGAIPPRSLVAGNPAAIIKQYQSI